MTNQLESPYEVPSAPGRDVVGSARTLASAPGASNAVAGAVMVRATNSGGFNDGPVVAAGLMVAGGILAAGVGFAYMVLDDDGSLANAPRGDQESAALRTRPAPPTPPAQPEHETVTLPDKNGNGVADALEPGARHEARARPTGPVTKPVVYAIAPGDTLAEISRQTRVPLDTLAQLNDIQNPNLIYAGASLLLPPAS
jgi:hypothetical protein